MDKQAIRTTSSLLCASSVLALIAGTGTADAAEWDVRVGGFYEGYVRYSGIDVKNVAPGSGDDYSGVDNFTDAEVWFLPSITLDNGIKIGANIQLEALTAKDQIDESFMTIEGSFGEFVLGSTNSAGYKMQVVAPDKTFLLANSGSTTAFVPFTGTTAGYNVGNGYTRATLGTTIIENDRNDDAQRFTYFTPNFEGLKLGFSYARDPLQDNNAQVNLNNAPISNIVDVGARYTKSFSDVDLDLSGRWGIGFDKRSRVPGTSIGKNPELYAFGANIGYAGFTVGGSWAEQNNTDLNDGQSWDVGISYETGPWEASVVYVWGTNLDDEFGTGANLGQFGNDERVYQILGGVNYILAEGVKFGVLAGYVNFDEDTSDLGTSRGDGVTGWFASTAVKISF